MDDLDRILASEETIEPSSGFAASVMDGVRREAAIPAPIPFPWRRLVPGLAACLLLTAGGILLVARVPDPIIHIPRIDPGDFAASPRFWGVAWAVAALLGSWAATRLARRLARA